MYDDARLAAALETGLVENDTFEVTQAHDILVDGTIIRNCAFYQVTTNTFTLHVLAEKVSVTGCLFHYGRRTDEMTPLYDLLEESDGRAQA